MLIGSETSGLEWGPAADQSVGQHAKYKSFMPTHTYLLIEQGVHIGEFHNLEELWRDQVYEFCLAAPRDSRCARWPCGKARPSHHHVQ